MSVIPVDWLPAGSEKLVEEFNDLMIKRHGEADALKHAGTLGDISRLHRTELVQKFVNANGGTEGKRIIPLGWLPEGTPETLLDQFHSSMVLEYGEERARSFATTVLGDLDKEERLKIVRNKIRQLLIKEDN